MYLIAGLGNPGKQYTSTRHNIGFSAIDCISQKHNIDVSKTKYKGIIGEGTIAGEKVILLKPQTFMNLSGESVREAATFHKIPPENVIIIHDDISLPAGTLRIREKGSAGGHNGLKSIIAHLNSQDFPRMKIGVGAPQPDKDLADYVLGRFSKEEEKILSEVLDRVCDAVSEYIKNGAKSAMSRYNG